MDSKEPTYRADVDGLRAVAVLAVVVFHAFPELLPGGFVGVDVFFVISGYLITGIIVASIEKGTFSLRTFYARRINRLFPALLVVITSFYLLGWLVLLADEYQSFGSHMVAASLFGSNVLLSREIGYFDPDVAAKPLLHLWSLAVEEQFYIVWPLLLIFVAKQGCKAALFMIGIGALSVGLNLYQTYNDELEAFYSPLTRAWELLLGAFLTRVSISSPATVRLLGDRGRSLLALLGLMLIILACGTFRPDHFFPGWRAFVPTVGTALVITAGPTAWLNRRVLATPVLVGIGLMSFPLYLWHWPFLSFGHILTSGATTLETRLNLVALSFILAFGTYRFIERPLRTRTISCLRIALLCVGMGCLGALGLVTVKEGGFRERGGISVLKAGEKRFPYRHSCEEITKASFRDDWCHPGNTNGAPQVILLGDSFSNGYASTFLRMSEKHPFTFKQFARGQCPLLFGYGPKPCREILEAVVTSLDRSKLHTVVLALDWRAYVYGKEYMFMPGRPPPESARSFETALRTTIDFWHTAGQRVVLFYSPPQGIDPRQCGRRYKDGKLDTAMCSQSLAQAIEQELDYRNTLLRIVKDLQNVVFFDPFPYFCEQGSCTVLSGRDLLYRDFVRHPTRPWLTSSHLSQAGAVLLADKAGDDIAALILGHD
jgi:peptidoglycan/LPS O-acetylase OafA/YrhL